MSRFLIIGLPRSGTTYLATLLNSHKNVLCEGELFNPYAIVGVGWSNPDPVAITGRDRNPAGYLQGFFRKHRRAGHAVGCKWMIGHHVEIMDLIQQDPELRILYVHRANKLAQASSWQKAIRTKQWATGSKDEVDSTPIDAGPLFMAQRCREMLMQDKTAECWLDRLANPILRIEYCDMFQDGFEADLCAFLHVPYDAAMKSPLVKQGDTDILSRFSQKDDIATYFREIGYSAWLQPEI